MGTLTRKGDCFTISFDVGFVLLMHERSPAKLSYSRRHRIGALSAFTSIQQMAAGNSQELPEGSLIGTSIHDDSKPLSESVVANFWAPARTNADVAEFVLIASTYKLKAK